jgi:hypothetical protein
LLRPLLGLIPTKKKSSGIRRGKNLMAISEDEEFEFRARAEQEAAKNSVSPASPVIAEGSPPAAQRTRMGAPERGRPVVRAPDQPQPRIQQTWPEGVPRPVKPSPSAAEVLGIGIGKPLQLMASGARGVVKTALSAPGELEKLAAGLTGADGHSIKELVTSPEKIQTVFPNAEDVERYLPNVPGLPQGSPFQQLGEFVPTNPMKPIQAATEKLPALSRGAGQALGTMRALPDILKGGRIERATEALKGNLTQEARRAAQEAEKGAAASGRVAEAAEAKKSGLIGESKTAADVGREARERVEKVAGYRSGRRAADAEYLRNEAVNRAAQKEAAGYPVSKSEGISRAVREIDDTLRTIPQGNAARKEYEALKKQIESADFEQLDFLRRQINDAAYKPDAEGFKAIGQVAARKIGAAISDAMKSFEPKFGDYLKNYAEHSKSLNLGKTKQGKAFLKESVPGVSDVEAASLPGKIFSSPEQFDLFVKQTGSRDRAEKLALDYLQGELIGKDSSKILAELERRKDFLKSVPAVEKRLRETIANPMKALEDRIEIATSSKEAAEKMAKSEADFVKKMGLRDTPQETMSAVRDYLQKSNLPDSKRNDLIKQVRELEKHVNTREDAKKVVKWVLIGLGGYGTARGVGSLTGAW